MRQRGFRGLKKLAAATLAAVLAVPASAFAEPTAIEELNEIMEAQNAEAKTPLLEEMLGLEELGEAIGENGLTLGLDFGLPAETIELLELGEEIGEGNYLHLQAQVDPNLKKWLLTMGAGAGGEKSLLDLSLYGDKEQLALSMPQFFAGAVALRAGNLLEQYNGSILKEMAGELPAEANIDMDFYPEMEGLQPAEGAGDLEALFEQKAEEIENSMTAEKSEADGQIVYAVTLPVSVVTDLYREIFSQYSTLLMSTGAVEAGEVMDFEDQVQTLIDTVELAMDEELVLNFYVQDQLVTKIGYSLTMDMNKIMEMEAALNEELAAGDQAEDVVVVTEDAAEPEYNSEQVMTLEYQVIFRNPKNPEEGMDILVSGKDGSMTEQMNMEMNMVGEHTETTSAMSISLKVNAEGEEVYNGEIYRHALDTETGACEAELKIQDETSSVFLRLDSTFENVEKGKQFDWVIGELSLNADGEAMGLNGKVSVSADPGEFEAPTESRMIMELTQEEFISLFTEIQIKAATWAQQFAPEVPETELAAE